MYYRNYSSYYIPDGYSLIKNNEHKKQRLENEKKGLEARIDTLQDILVKAEEKRKLVEDELKKLK